MKVLVTGGAGYLGSVLSLTLLEAGHDVRVIDSLMYGAQGLLPLLGHPRFELQVADLRDQQALEKALSGVDAVVHLAAIVGDPACARNPELAVAVNEVAATHLIGAASAAEIPRFVFA